MIKIHYYIESRKGPGGTRKSSDEDCPLILSVVFPGQRIMVYTGRKVKRNQWDKSAERMFPVFSGAYGFNEYLTQLKNRVGEFAGSLLEQGSVLNRKEIRGEIRKLVKTDNPPFFSMLIEIIERNQPEWKSSTYRKMKSFYNGLREFSSGGYGEILTSRINASFSVQLVEFYRKKGLKDTSIKKNLDLLKWTMRMGVKQGMAMNRDFTEIRFTPERATQVSDPVCLNWSELITLYKTTGLDKKEEWCRDIFCFIAFTGIRFSDIHVLMKESVQGNNIRTGNEGNTKVLLNRFAEAICNRYANRYYRSNTLFPLISLITFNKYIKLVAQKSGLKRVTGSGGKLLQNEISARSAISTFRFHSVRLGLTRLGDKELNKDPLSRRLAAEKYLEESARLYESVFSVL